MWALFLFWKDRVYSTQFAFSKEVGSFLQMDRHLGPEEYVCTLLACLFLFWDKISPSSPGTNFSLYLPPECWYHRWAPVLCYWTAFEVNTLDPKLFLEGQLRVHFRNFFFELYLWGFSLLLSGVLYPWIPSNIQGWWEEKAGFPWRQYPSPQIILWWIKCLMFPFVQGHKRNNWSESPSDTCVVWETRVCTSLFCNAHV